MSRSVPEWKTPEWKIMQELLDMRVKSWREASQRGDRCGILGCYMPPVKRCPFCGCYYCRSHWHIHYHEQIPLKVQRLI